MSSSIRMRIAMIAAVMVMLAGVGAQSAWDSDADMRPLQHSWVTRGNVHTAWASVSELTPATVKNRITLQDGTVDALEVIHLATLVVPDATPVFDLVWEREDSLWFPGWRLKLRHVRPGDDVTKVTEQTLSRSLPAPGHTYETLVSYNPESGLVAYSIRDISNGTMLQEGTVLTASPGLDYRFTTGYSVRNETAAEPVRVDSLEWVPVFLPIGGAWDVAEETASGALLPSTSFDLDRSIVVSLNPDYVGNVPGTFRLVYEGARGRAELAKAFESAPEAEVRIPAASLGLGLGTLRLEYVDDGAVVFTDARDVSIGYVHVRIDHRTATVVGGNLQASALVESAEPVSHLPFEIEAVLTEWAWNNSLNRHEKNEVEERTLFSGTIDVSGEGTAIPLEMPLPDRPGNWEVRFKASSPAATVRLSVLGDRLYSTHTEDVGQFTVCTYNVLGFRGWPQNAAARELGQMSFEQQLGFFANVLRKLDCDILGIQEGRSFTWLSGVAEAAGVHASLFRTPSSFPGAILSGFPILESRDFTTGLVGTTVPFSRSAGAALLEIHGAPVWVVNIHAHYNSEALRSVEADVLASKLDELIAVTEHVIVLGDFNSQSGSIHDTLRQRGFLNTVELSGGGVAHTMTDEQGEGRLAIDYIYVSPSLLGKVKSSRVVSDPGFRISPSSTEDDWVYSDHLPVMAVLEW